MMRNSIGYWKDGELKGDPSFAVRNRCIVALDAVTDIVHCRCFQCV